MTEYRIEYTIQRRRPGDDDFIDVGFGTSASARRARGTASPKRRTRWSPTSRTGSGRPRATCPTRTSWSTRPPMSETFLQRRRVQRPGVVQLRKLIVTRAWADVTPRGSGPSRRENPAPTEGGA